MLFIRYLWRISVKGRWKPTTFITEDPDKEEFYNGIDTSYSVSYEHIQHFVKTGSMANVTEDIEYEEGKLVWISPEKEEYFLADKNNPVFDENKKKLEFIVKSIS